MGALLTVAVGLGLVLAGAVMLWWVMRPQKRSGVVYRATPKRLEMTALGPPDVYARNLGEPRPTQAVRQSPQQYATERWRANQGIGLEHGPGSGGSQDDRTIYAMASSVDGEGRRY